MQYKLPYSYVGNWYIDDKTSHKLMYETRTVRHSVTCSLQSISWLFVHCFLQEEAATRKRFLQWLWSRRTTARRQTVIDSPFSLSFHRDVAEEYDWIRGEQHHDTISHPQPQSDTTQQCCFHPFFFVIKLGNTRIPWNDMECYDSHRQKKTEHREKYNRTRAKARPP